MKNYFALLLFILSQDLIAQDIDFISVKRMSMELARDIASNAVKDCRKKGYQVTAVVVDKGGNKIAILRDVLASRFTMQIAEEKANAVILGGVSSAEFRQNRKDILAEMNQVEGIMVLGGGLPIRVAGTIVGAVGVSGALGADKDEDCARAGIKSVQDRLDFAD